MQLNNEVYTMPTINNKMSRKINVQRVVTYYYVFTYLSLLYIFLL